MNFVISHEQTSQSGTNPVILLPNLSGRGRRRRRPGSVEAQPGTRASAGATVDAHLLPRRGPGCRYPLPHGTPGTGVGVSQGREVGGSSSASPDNEG